MKNELSGGANAYGSRLRELNLSNNPFGEPGVAQIAKGLRGNSTLRRLTMRYVNLNPSHPSEGHRRLEPFPLVPLLASSGLEVNPPPCPSPPTPPSPPHTPHTPATPPTLPPYTPLLRP